MQPPDGKYSASIACVDPKQFLLAQQTLFLQILPNSPNTCVSLNDNNLRPQERLAGSRGSWGSSSPPAELLDLDNPFEVDE